MRQGNLVVVATTLCLAGQLLLLLTETLSIPSLLISLLSSYLLLWVLYALLSSISRTELHHRFLLTTSSMALSLILAEGAALLGVVDYRGVFGSFESGNALSVPGRHADRDLLWQHEAYYQYEEPYQGNLALALCHPSDASQTVAIRYDQHGFRNSTDLQQADIVVIGDSYIEGYMTPEPMLATTLLSHLQGKTVANLGHSGYGPQQELVVLQRYGLPLQPHTVIWTLFEGNDFEDAERYEHTAARRGSPFLEDAWYGSLTRNVLTRIFRPPGTCRPHTGVQQSQAKFLDERRIARSVYFAPSEIDTPSASRWRTVLLSIAAAARLCQEKHIQFVVVFVPEKYRVYRDLPNVMFASETMRARPVSNVPVELGRGLRDFNLGIEYVDLTVALKEESRRGIATYLSDDTHWTLAGNRVVAEVLHRSLLSLSRQARGS